MKKKIPLPFEWNAQRSMDDESYRGLKWLFLMAIAACLVNPHFLKGAVYPLKILLSVGNDAQVFFKNIVELAPPITWSNILSLHTYPVYKFLILISLGSFIFNFKKIDVTALMLWLMLLLVSLKAVRNMPYFAFLSFFVFIANYQHINPYAAFQNIGNNKKMRLGISICFKVMLCFWMLSYIGKISVMGYYDFERYERKSEYGQIALRSYPIKAADFLAQEGIKGAFYNDFNSGSYLIGRLSPHIKVFIDGRTELYGAKYFKEYQDIVGGDYEAFQKAADQYQLTGAFLNSIRVPASRHLIKSLYDDPEWRLVYFDYDASIFLRDIPLNQPWTSQFEIDFLNWQPPKFDILKMGLQLAAPFSTNSKGVWVI